VSVQEQSNGVTAVIKPVALMVTVFGGACKVPPLSLKPVGVTVYLAQFVTSTVLATRVVGINDELKRSALALEIEKASAGGCFRGDG